MTVNAFTQDEENGLILDFYDHLKTGVISKVEDMQNYYTSEEFLFLLPYYESYEERRASQRDMLNNMR